MSNFQETDHMIENSNEERNFQIKEIFFYVIYGIGSTIIFWIYKSYVAESEDEKCITVKPVVNYLAFQNLFGTILLIIFGAVIYYMRGNNSNKKRVIFALRLIFLIMIGVYALILNFLYAPEIYTCNLAFVFCVLGLVVFDILFVFFCLKKFL